MQYIFLAAVGNKEVQLNESIHVKCLLWCLAYGKSSKVLTTVIIRYEPWPQGNYRVPGEKPLIHKSLNNNTRIIVQAKK